jgi:hypothetical protein
MAIAIDANSGVQFANPGSSLTFNHTCAAGAVLVFQGYGFSGRTISGVTYNGAAMTAVDAYTDSTGFINATFILLNPTSGTNSVVVSTTGSAGGLTGCTLSYTGCSTSSNPQTFGHSSATIPQGTNPSVTITNVTGGALVGWAAKGNSITNGVTGGTERTHEPNVFNGGWGDILGAASGSQTYAGTLSTDGAGTNTYTAQVMVLQPPAAAVIHSLSSTGAGA